jgi:hypothetical protein
MAESILPTDKLRLKVEKLWLEHIKLCQDNFLYFVKEVWPDIIMKQEKDPNKWGHHQIMLMSLLRLLHRKKGGSLSICLLDILNLNSLRFCTQHG